MGAVRLIERALAQGIAFIPAPDGRFSIKGPPGVIRSLRAELETCREEVRACLSFLLDLQVKKAVQSLEQKGYVLIRSHRLNRMIALTRNGRLPELPARTAVLTVEEMTRLLPVLRENPEALKAVLDAREVLGGEIVEVKNTSLAEAGKKHEEV